ncbi:TPA: hypothetical protein ACSPZI_002475 [Aeromonas hydrophila]
MNIKQTISREEYRRLDNRVTCILQQRWPAIEISQWVKMLKGKQQSVACAILRRRHPNPISLALPAIVPDVPNPFQARVNRPTVPLLSADGRTVGRRHIVKGLTPVAIDQNGNIRCAVTGHTLFIALGSKIDKTNPGTANQLNPHYKLSQHIVVTDHRKNKRNNQLAKNNI